MRSPAAKFRGRHVSGSWLSGVQTGRGIGEEEASMMIVNGFIDPLVKQLPMEYAVELNRLIELEMEGSVG